jgi:uncharacterized protein (DUF1778 family)
MGAETQYGQPAASYKTDEPVQSVRINLRCPPAVRDLIDAAAESLGISRTAFLLRASKAEAFKVLMPSEVK